MKVEHLNINYFRNLEGIEIVPFDGVNIICGDNAQGKTNLLEAIWLFTGSKSFRTSREKDFIPNSGNFAKVEISFFSGGRAQTATMGWEENRKIIELNGIKKQSSSAFGGVFCGVFFTPDHLSLVKDGPENRRNMIDSSLAQAYPKYSRGIINYQKALKQRNTLLKDISYNSSLMELLPVWDEHIINYGSYITRLRDGYIKKLGEYSTEVYKGISGNKEKLKLTYRPSFEICSEDGCSLDDLKQLLAEELVKTRAEDLRLGTTSVGPHRDDIEIEIDGLSARGFGSQGQQRSSILAMKLAECSILEEQAGEPPVVMLDDVMSELDSHRKNFLLNRLKNKQVFITGCDTTAFSELKKGKIFFINKGNLTEEKEV